MCNRIWLAAASLALPRWRSFGGDVSFDIAAAYTSAGRHWWSRCGEICPRGLCLGLWSELDTGEVKATDVVALCVVRVLAECLSVLLGNLATLCGLLDGEADSTTFKINIDDLDPQLFTRRDDLLREDRRDVPPFRRCGRGLRYLRLLVQRRQRERVW